MSKVFLNPFRVYYAPSPYGTGNSAGSCGKFKGFRESSYKKDTNQLGPLFSCVGSLIINQTNIRHFFSDQPYLTSNQVTRFAKTSFRFALAMPSWSLWWIVNMLQPCALPSKKTLEQKGEVRSRLHNRAHFNPKNLVGTLAPSFFHNLYNRTGLK